MSDFRPPSPSSSDATVLLVGGYGLVGSEIATLLRARHPRMRLLLGGRSPDSGRAFATELGNAEAVRVDASAADPLADLGAERIDVVVTVVNDPGDLVLMAAARRGIAVVDITRWTARVHRALVSLAGETLAAPVVLASGWMGGLASIAAAAASQRVGGADRLFVDILYAMTDRSGPDSVAYMDRLAIPFEALRDGEERMAWPMTDRRRAGFAGGISADTWRLDTPEQLTLPAFTGARTVETRIAFDSVAATIAMAAMQRLGIFALLQRPRFTALRRALLHVSGPGATTRFTVEAQGRNAASRVRLQFSDAKGQAHLTAVGALLSIERVLGIDGAAHLDIERATYVGVDGANRLGPRVYFPEQFADSEALLATASSLGVEIASA